MKITYIKTNFLIKPEDELRLPYFKGSGFRGAFGNVFRKIACALKRSDCENCMLKNSCVYAYVFETPPPTNRYILNMGKYKSIPHPFVIEPPLTNGRVFTKDDILQFSVIAIGRAIDYLPYFVYTFIECGKVGLGKGRGKYKLIEVNQEDTKLYKKDEQTIKRPSVQQINIETETESNPELQELTLKLITPLRIKHQRDLVTKLEFFILIKSLLLRLNLLNFYHCNGDMEEFDYKKLISLATNVKIIKEDTHWWDWERYSTRQNTRMKMGGLLGEITYTGDLKPFLSLIKAGEILHTGKNTSFGLGKYKIIDNKETQV